MDQEVDFEFVIPDKLLPVLESRGIDGELLCDVEFWKGIVDTFAIEGASVLYTVVIKGLKIGDDKFLETPEERVQGKMIADDVLDEFPDEGMSVYFEIYGMIIP